MLGIDDEIDDTKKEIISMKKNYGIFLLLILFSLHYAAFSQTKHETISIIQKDTWYILKNEASLIYYHNGIVKEAILARDAVLGRKGSKPVKPEIRFKAGKKIFFYESGMVSDGVLAKNVRLNVNDNHITFKAGSVLELYDYFNLHRDLFVSHLDVKVEKGILAEDIRWKEKAGGRQINIAAGDIISLSEDQSLKVPMEADTYIKVREDKFKFQADSIIFGKMGWVKEGVLAEDSFIPVTITRKREFAKFKKGTIARFTDNDDCKGRILAGILAEDSFLKVGKLHIKFKANTPVVFYPEMGGGLLTPEYRIVRQGVLAEDLTIVRNGITDKFPKNSEIEFDKAGDVR